ncbi:substrate-binding domain-containing protein [Streptomyces sp. DSM 44917]|uniref:Substrate-binding domain-containing protein n=1 Tax=Streptomyces boetiae TaxID=3075541 RepID=A0ABU2LD58_9ACTN|nr:substrate-binding domain-containing protein [Streptomyces sp. DSM 44917]MDT0309505.1 substrate-binding domain-containing protein [Streptomyces sp. DSM 44917]
MIISDIDNAFFTSLVRGIEDVARPAGLSVVLCNSDEDPAKEGRYVSAVLAERMAGVVLSPCARSPHAARLAEGGVPLVAIDRPLPGPDTPAVDTVLVDNERASASAVAHLLAAGYRRVACVTGPEGIPTADQRLAGYRAALAAAGLPADERLVRRADFRERGGYAAMDALLDEDPAPDAVFAANNLMTVGALACLADRNVPVPARMGVVGFDEIPWATLIEPAPTTVVQPTYDLGRTAAELLAQRLTHPGRAPATVTLTTGLRVRATSAGPGLTPPA